MEFDAIRKALGFHETVKFNLERGKRASIKGHVMDYLLGKAIKRWHKLAEDKKDAIVAMLVDPGLGDDELVGQLARQHELTEDQAGTVSAVDLGEG